LGNPAIFLAFDYGTRNIGVAVGQKVTRSANTLEPIVYQSTIPWHKIDQLLKDWQPEALIVGVPHKIHGGDLKITVLAEKFIAQLQERYGLPVYDVEEMLTTKAAREEIFKRGGYRALQNQSIDSFAAKIILEAWLGE
jgi:putative Holliday junction resolvase